MERPKVKESVTRLPPLVHKNYNHFQGSENSIGNIESKPKPKPKQQQKTTQNFL
jgi:hypothetical protein